MFKPNGTESEAGNDLARVLNWGGSMGSYASHRARDMLRAVNQSTVALLDRWNVSIQPTVRCLCHCTAVCSLTCCFISIKICAPLTWWHGHTGPRMSIYKIVGPRFHTALRTSTNKFSTHNH